MRRYTTRSMLRPVYVFLLVPLFLYLSWSFNSHSKLILRREEARLQEQALNTYRTSLAAEAELLVPKCANKLTAVSELSGAPAREKASSFVLLFMGHSGSTALISALQQHPDVYVKGFEPLDHGAMARNTSAALEYARRFFEAGIEMNKTVGFKLRPYHIQNNHSEWADLFREFDTRIIWNYRSNVFKQAIGHYPIVYLNDTSRFMGLARTVKTNTNRKRKKKRLEKYAIHNMTAFYELLSSRYRGERRVENALVALGIPCVLPLSYELLLGNPNKASLTMQSFLNLPLNHTLQAARTKATGDNMCKVVTNWDEVCESFFMCHRWRGMMDNPEIGCTCPVVVKPDIGPGEAQRFCQPAGENSPKDVEKLLRDQREKLLSGDYMDDSIRRALLKELEPTQGEGQPPRARRKGRRRIIQNAATVRRRRRQRLTLGRVGTTGTTRRGRR